MGDFVVVAVALALFAGLIVAAAQALAGAARWVTRLTLRLRAPGPRPVARPNLVREAMLAHQHGDVPVRLSLWQRALLRGGVLGVALASVIGGLWLLSPAPATRALGMIAGAVCIGLLGAPLYALERWGKARRPGFARSATVLLAAMLITWIGFGLSVAEAGYLIGLLGSGSPAVAVEQAMIAVQGLYQLEHMGVAVVVALVWTLPVAAGVLGRVARIPWWAHLAQQAGCAVSLMVLLANIPSWEVVLDPMPWHLGAVFAPVLHGMALVLLGRVDRIEARRWAGVPAHADPDSQDSERAVDTALDAGA